MSNSLEVILSNLAVQHAAQTAAAIREFLGGLLGGAPAPVAAPAKKKLGRPAKAAQAPTAKAAEPKRRKARTGTPTFTDADVASVLEMISARPGQAPSAYQKASKLSEKVFKNLLVKLKREGKVKVNGIAKGTTYTVA